VDATPEQRTNHQLRRRVRHLEHDHRNITAHCQSDANVAWLWRCW
jgi:hypothetical protein